MELILTGDFMSAEEAHQRGLVSRIYPAETLVDEAIKVAQKIATFSQPIVMMAKECVNQAYETSLSAGLLFERRVFHSTFAYNDRKEGMSAYLDKKTPQFKDN